MTAGGGRGVWRGPDAIVAQNELRDLRRRVGDLDARVAAKQSDSSAVLLATLVADFNALLAKLRAAGLMKP